MTNANGASVDYSYDTLNRLSTVKDNNLIALNGGVTNYTYDTVGDLQSYQYPNGVMSSYAYNSLNRLTTMTVGTSVTALASYSYTLGAAGNRTGVTELGGRTLNYTYDDLHRLTSESIANDPHGVNGSASYSYDPAGNRLNRSSSIAPVPSQNSTYDPNDRLTSDIYDNNGNTTLSSGKSLVTQSSLLRRIGVPYGSRTRVAAVKGRCPRPLDERDALWGISRSGEPRTLAYAKSRCQTATAVAITTRSGVGVLFGYFVHWVTRGLCLRRPIPILRLPIGDGEVEDHALRS